MNLRSFDYFFINIEYTITHKDMSLDITIIIKCTTFNDQKLLNFCFINISEFFYRFYFNRIFWVITCVFLVMNNNMPRDIVLIKTS